MNKEEAQKLRKIYQLVDQLPEDAKSHLATNLYQTAEILEEDHDRFTEIHQEFLKYQDEYKIEKPSDIADLPWKGNNLQDSKLFDLIADYILSEKDREKQKEAYYLMGKHGMGIDEEVADEELDEFIKQANLKNVNFKQM